MSHQIRGLQACAAMLFVSAFLACGGGDSAQPSSTTTPPVVEQGSFVLKGSESALTMSPGGSGSLWVQLQNLDGFKQSVKITCPSGIQGISFSPASFTLSQNQTQTLQINASANATEGDRQITLAGSYGSLSGSLPLAVHITYDNATFVPETTDLPVLNITTTNGAPIVSKDDYITGHMGIDPNGSDATFTFDGDIQIRGRGNSTWWMPKKPYRLKLSDKTALFGFPKSKDWVLLANYSDKTLMRNIVAMELSSRLELAYTPRNTPVEVYLNGTYQGSYLFIESIKVASNRVNIPSLSETDIFGDTLTGGYLLEFDVRQDQPVHFNASASGLPINVHDPDPPMAEQLAYITNYVNEAENALYGTAFTDPTTGYENYFDVDSFINWYLLNEVFANVDSYFYSSCYFYKQRSGKLFMGPAWDFDLGAGNVDYADCEFSEGWWTRSAPWIQRMFEDPAFARRVKDRWNAVKASQLDTIFTFIDARAILLDRTQQNNFQRWPILGVYVWPNPVIPGTYQGEVDQFKTWLTQRIAWMDTQFNP